MEKAKCFSLEASRLEKIQYYFLSPYEIPYENTSSSLAENEKMVQETGPNCLRR